MIVFLIILVTMKRAGGLDICWQQYSLRGAGVLCPKSNELDQVQLSHNPRKLLMLLWLLLLLVLLLLVFLLLLLSLLVARKLNFTVWSKLGQQ